MIVILKDIFYQQKTFYYIANKYQKIKNNTMYIYIFLKEILLKVPR